MGVNLGVNGCEFRCEFGDKKMEISAKIVKRKSGKSAGLYIVRLKYFDESVGKYRHLERHSETKTGAVDLRDKLKSEVAKTDGGSLSGEKMTFNDLANICEKLFYQPATIANGKKIKGVKSFKTKQTELKRLREFFGKRRIRDLRKESLVDYKIWRLKTVSEKTKKPLSIATINKELSTMRTIVRYAYGEGLVLRDIFFNAKVIDKSSEIERSRILTTDEEQRLLAVCVNERQHLKPIILLAVDSGLRRGEIFKIQWKDIDFMKNIINVAASITKTERNKIVPLSQRVKDELLDLQPYSNSDRPFPFVEIKRAFNTAKRLAKIEDLHFHDLRRTAVVRWVQNGVPLALAGKIAGHSELQTTMKHYIANDIETVQGVVEKLNAFHSQVNGKAAVASEMVN